MIYQVINNMDRIRKPTDIVLNTHSECEWVLFANIYN